MWQYYSMEKCMRECVTRFMYKRYKKKSNREVKFEREKKKNEK